MTWWKKSRLRFYILNAVWNYKFWLLAEKIYKNHTYDVPDEKFDLEDVDVTGRIQTKNKKVTKRRFVGYMYENALYLDNPGIKHKVDSEVWSAWKKKGLIKI